MHGRFEESAGLIITETDYQQLYLEEHEQKPEVRPGASLWLSWEPRVGRLLHPEGV